MEKFQELVPQNIRDYLAVSVLVLGGGYVALKVTGRLLGCVSKCRRMRRWRNTKKDVVILHTITPTPACPSASPFVLKLETYLRMANIPYEIDLVDGMGPKGKTPWITLNGEHISDSQLCIEFLAKKFDKRIGNHSDQEKAIGTMVRLSLDEQFYWGLLMWRYYYSWEHGEGPNKIMPNLLPTFLLPILRPIIKRMIYSNCWIHGIGRHSKEDVINMTNETLRAVANILGSKKFILGDEPTEDDCAIFGELAQILWCMPGSPFEKLLNDELHNLKQYCLRMKEAYWPDWNEKLLKGYGESM